MTFTGRSPWRSGGIEFGMVGIAALAALLVGFHPPAEAVEEWGDAFGIGFSLIGFLVGASFRASNRDSAPHAGPMQASGWLLLATGLLTILGQLPLAALCGLLSLLLSGVALFHGALARHSQARLSDLPRLFHIHGPSFCRFALLVLLLETWETAVVSDRSPATMAEIGLFSLLAALAALGWAAGSHSKRLDSFSRTNTPATPYLWGAATLLVLFGGLAAAIYLPPVQTLDAAAGQNLYHCGARGFTRLIRKISDSGGRDLMIYWLPVCLLLTRFIRGPRGVTFLAASMFGTIGLELLFKGLLGRMRPEYTHGSHFDSFPSGHTLAAAILAGSLLVVYLPICRYGWQRALLWAAGLGWPVLMGFTRLYLGRHYFTDVLGGLVLGAAWVLFAVGTFRLFTRQMENEASPNMQSSTFRVASETGEAGGSGRASRIG